jgi:tetratricopeptide (TPR) repeat protein
LNIYAGAWLSFPCFEKGMLIVKRALEANQKEDNLSGVGQSYQLMAFAYEWSARLELALEAAKQSISVLERIGDSRELGMTLNELYGLYWRKADYTSALAVVERYRVLSERGNDYFGIASSWMMRGTIALETGKLSQAEELLEKGASICLDHEQWYKLSLIRLVQGNLFIAQGDADKAINALDEARQLYEKHRFVKYKFIRIYPAIVEAYLLKSEQDPKALKMASHWARIPVNIPNPGLRMPRPLPLFLPESWLPRVNKNKRSASILRGSIIVPNMVSVMTLPGASLPMRYF